MRRFEFAEGNSNKFWEIEQDGSDLNIRWGRIGTQGQSQTKNFADAAKAAAALDKLVTEKTGKGYAETAGGAAAAPAKPLEKIVKEKKVEVVQAPAVATVDVVAAPAAEEVAVAAAPAPAAADIELDALPPLPAAPAGTPPWLARGEPLDFDAAWKGLISPSNYNANVQALPSRRFPAAAPAADARLGWLQAREHMLKETEIDPATCDASLLPLLQQTWDRLQQRGLHGSDESDALLLALALKLMSDGQGSADGSIAEYLIASRGLPQAVQLLLQAQRLDIALHSTWHGSSRGHSRTFGVTRQVSAPFSSAWHGPLTSEERVFRRHFSFADEAVWRECVAQIQAEIATLHPARQVVMAMLLPDAPEIANDTALRLAGPAAPDALFWLQLTATSSEALAAIRARNAESNYFFHNPAMLATLLQERRLDMLPLLLDVATMQHPGDLLRHFGLPEAITALAKVASSSKTSLQRLNQAAQRWPLAAIPALAQLAGANTREAALVTPLLSQLVQKHDAVLPGLRPWLTPAAQGVIDRLLAQLQAPVEVAGLDEVPRVLADPPWLKPRKTLANVPGLAPLPEPAQEHWDEAERASAAQLSVWQRNRYSGSKAMKEIADDLGFKSDWTTQDEEGNRRLREQAIAAIESNDAAALIEAWRGLKATRKYFYVNVDGAALAQLPDELAVPVWNDLAGEGHADHQVELMAARYGLRAWPGVFKAIRRSLGAYIELALRYADADMAGLAARAHAKLKTLRRFGRDWLLRYPEVAAAALIAPALGKPGEARDCAGAALRFLAASGHESLILAAAARYARADVEEGVRHMLAEDPLDRFPSKRSELPSFWTPRAWHRPLLAGSGKALPDTVLNHLGSMLAFPSNEELYAGVDQLRDACTRESLADFAWDLFNAWLAAGTPSKDAWAMQALGWFGNDDTARKLTPLIRVWPGEGAHARAVAGLDVLTAIGSDVALMLLNGIAQKVKFKGLQDKAREKIDAIAEARGLSTEELEDRLAPDLGLDEVGTLLLDFGPRQFRVGFDEALKPYVRDSDGARLADLPKPKKTDDAALAAAAVERFKLLKKDARTIASQQVLRLEVAMCTRRRWSGEVFGQFLATHPLLRHLVQRLVWGVYAMASAEDTQGGRLLSCFRVTEDGSYGDADDAPVELAQDEMLRIGLPHALELPADIAAAFGQLFADYELMQPFAQLGRDSYALSEEERAQTVLTRWKDKVVPTGRVLGLVNKGWRRGQAQDGGGIWYFVKPLQGEAVIELTLDPGIIVGMVDEYPEQKLIDITVGKTSAWGDMQNPQPLSALDAIAASELIRDMQALVGD